MKKIIILSLALLCLFSCSSNDSEMVDPDTSGEVVTDGGDGSDSNGGTDSDSDSDNDSDNSDGTEAKDPIIGTWTLFAGTDGVEVNDCLKKTTFIFNEDNSYSQIEYNMVTYSCDEILNVTGEWTSKGNDVYNLRRDTYTSGPDVDFEFSEDGKTMVVVRQTYKRQ